MVGDGPQRRECEAAVRESRLPIRFAGFLNQSEIVRAYVATDAVVLPSEGETWGLVVNEAMACGKPALVSDRVGCGPDLVSPGETGFVFPFGNVQALASLMVDGASCPDRLMAMGAHARDRLNRQHSIEAAVNRLIDALAHTVRSSS
jgi:glycosyltransferase involved in cell wall biosynthesis